MKRVRVEVEYPDGSRETFGVPSRLSFHVARAIAQGTYCAAILFGQYGQAEFKPDGSGRVTWNAESTMPGKVTEFDARMTVCL